MLDKIGGDRLIACVLSLLMVLGAVTYAGCKRERKGPEWYQPTRDNAAARAANHLGTAAREHLEGLAPAPAPPVEQPKPPADIGKEAAKRSLEKAARGVYAFSWIIGVLSAIGLVAGSFFGGIGRKSALTGLAIAGGGLWVQYFILAHGYLVSEAISWAVIVSIFTVGPMLAYQQFRTHWDGHVARKVADKRASEAMSAKDAIMKLPVSKKIKKQLDDAWDALLAGNAATRMQAIDLLTKYKLPIPPTMGK